MNVTKLRAGLLATALVALSPAFAQTATPVADPSASVAHPSLWPAAKSQGLVDAKTERFVTDLMTRMTLEEKIGQMIQADVGSIKPEDLRRYPLGSILVGGSTPPIGAPDRTGPTAWLNTANAFGAVANEKRAGHTVIPLMFGIDAVHGNNNVIGATLFPHNIGLGAMRDPALIRKIGQATAVELAATGWDWAFGPTIAVPQDDRWGRTYEGYSEDPSIVRSYAGLMIEGLQGKAGGNRIQDGHVAASAKHFLGDGGTKDGVDQGDDQIPESELVAIHNAGYPAAIDAGTMTIMASYNSWHGQKTHGNKTLLTDVLKGKMGFDGFVIGDWNGHAQVAGCTKDNCAQTFIAGLDMAMAPDGWKGLFDNTLAQVKAGTIPMARVDDAVRRILRVKAKLGLFDPARPLAGKFDLLGSPDHRAIAREAVAKSLVLLKNTGVLPLKANANILVAGAAADDVATQAGGWTLSWQGDGNTPDMFPGATSIYAGIAQAMKAGGGTATLSADGSFTKKPDVAVVVFGEQPYAEMRGDVRTLEFQPGDKEALAMLKALKAKGVPVVSVFLSGRPLWVNPELNQSDAFVAAWLPGSEGAGIADVLVGDAAGKPRRDFTGTLSFSWPKTAGQFTLNKGKPGYDPLFPLGYGLSYAKRGTVPTLGEVSGVDASLANTSLFFARGKVPAPFSFATDSKVTRAPVDSATTQEGAVKLTWPTGAASTIRIGGPLLDLGRETNAEVLMQITYRVDTVPTGKVALAMAGPGGATTLDATGLFTGDVGTWKTVRVPLKCFREAGLDVTKVNSVFALTASGPFGVSVSDLRLATDPSGQVCPPKM